MDTHTNPQNKDDADAGEQPIYRRAVMAAAGAVGSMVALSPVSADEHERTVEPGETIETPTCRERVYDHIECEARTRPWATGAITAIGCPDCDTGFQLSVEASDGISRDPCEESGSNTATEYVEPGERVTLWFDGHITSLTTSQSNARIAINQNNCTRPAD
ncbi:MULTISPECIES: hypothetical protein [Natrialbaceae]|uniref:hypothetical protein n=1 Tax=Natrialbaceae TaxID=1644061 RepID=UPI00207C8BBF|nr:hypothetical protein [Natronococcus sp. CG52]